MQFPRATHLVAVFALEEDARRVIDVLPKRFGKYGLTLHPEKTRLVPFQRPRSHSKAKRSGGSRKPGTFDLLGFTHFWGRSQKGNWVVKQQTAKKRMSRAVRTIGQWCKDHRHRPVAEQHQALVAKLRGHCLYYGIIGNYGSLVMFRFKLIRAWWKALDRRSQRPMWWHQFKRLLDRFPVPHPRELLPQWSTSANP